MILFNLKQKLKMFYTFLLGALKINVIYIQKFSQNYLLNYLNILKIREIHSESNQNISTIVNNMEQHNDMEQHTDMEQHSDEQPNNNEQQYNDEQPYKDEQQYTEMENHNNDVKEEFEYEDLFEKEMSYKINWTKEFKNLNKLLSIKGVNNNDSLSIFKFKYLIFSFSIQKLKNGYKEDLNLIYSLRLIVSDFNENSEDMNQNLYEKILNNIKKNSSLIKDGGILDIYYVCSKVDNTVKDSSLENNLNKMHIITDKIYLNKYRKYNVLEINIYIFTYEMFFNNLWTIIDKYFYNKYNLRDKMMWGYPILIIEDMNLPTVTYLFKEQRINAHGMSVSWRHKLSPLEENLSHFLYVTDLQESIQTSHLCFSDTIFTNNKLDYKLYKDISLIQEFNYLNYMNIFIKLKRMGEIINEVGIRQKADTVYINRKEQKYENIINSSMNPLVIILLKRNLLFELEKSLYEYQGQQTKILKIYTDINLELNNLMNSENDKQSIIEKLNFKINNLEEDIQKLKEEQNQKRIELNKQKEINKENKEILYMKSKTKRKLNIIKTITNKDIKQGNAETNRLNQEIIVAENLTKNKLREKEDMKNNLKYEQRDLNIFKDKIEYTTQTKNRVELELKSSSHNIENIHNELKKNNEISFDQNIVNNTNVRKNSLNNDVFISNKNKRKYSTLNNGVEKEKMKIMYQNKENSGTSVNQIYQEITTNPIYIKTTQILKSTVDNQSGKVLTNINKQLQIEETFKFFWNEELNSLFQGKKSLFSHYVGINILMSSMSKLDKVLSLFKEDKRYLKNKTYRNHIMMSQNGIIVSIVLTNIIPHMTKYKSNQNTATLFKNIGIELHRNLLQNQWSIYSNINNKKSTLTLEKRNYSIEINKNDYKFENGLSKIEFNDRFNNILGIISDEDYFKLGCDLSVIISENSQLYKMINIPMEDKTVQRAIVPGKNLEDQIVKLLSVELDKLPMICEPSKWKVSIDEKKKFKITKYGGYLLNSTNKNHFMNVSYKNKGKTTLDDLKMIECINYLGSVPYTINSQLLNHIINLVNANESGVYSHDHIFDSIKLNLHPKTMNLFNLNLKKKYGEMTEIQKHNSQFYNDKSVITFALMFSEWAQSSEFNNIYFNYFMDWRGRLYTDTNYLSVQGGNLARSLLMFKKGHILNDRGLEHLKVYTANCYGLDKLSYNLRLEWTNHNLNNILAVPNLDIDNTLTFDQNVINFYDFVMKADKPWLFLSCCIELTNYYLNKNNFISRLPVYLDATCSGLQHLSTMINDTNLAKHVNIKLSNKEDIPMDVYSHMISFVNNKIQEFIKIDHSLAILKNININRSFIKPGIMTISYGATSRGITEQLKTNHFKQLDLVKGKKLSFILTDKKFNNTDLDIIISAKQLAVLGKAIHSVLYEVFPNLNLLVKYLKNMNYLLKYLKLPTIWISPGGLIIEQNYAPLKKRNLETSILGQRKSVTITEMDRNLTDLRKQNNSIVPNIVHSFDASNIALLVEMLTSNFTMNKMNLITIHDCFATNANDVDEMIFKVKLAYIALYADKSFIDNYHKFILNFIQKTGFIIEEISTTSGEINSYVKTDVSKLLIPTPPSFSMNQNLRFDILSSQYFIN